MPTPFDALLATIHTVRHPSSVPEGESIVVSETIAVAASAYEAIRNTLEYDEEHLMRRNALRRIIKRRVQEEASQPLAMDVLRELVWARYLPNKKVPEAMIGTLAAVFEKYRPLFVRAQAEQGRSDMLFEWLLDLVSTEVECVLQPMPVDELLASTAYRELKQRMVWANPAMADADRDLQLYIAVHRAVLKSNVPTLRFRVFTLYYPGWLHAFAADPLVAEVATQLPTVVDAIERQLRHPAADSVFRLARQHAIVFHLIRDIAEADPDAFAAAMSAGNMAAIDEAISKAAERRYDRFRSRLKTRVVRAALFLFLTKMVLALILELPYEQFVLQSPDFRPLLVNIIFHPLLLCVIGLSVHIPQAKNNKKILDEVHALLGMGKDFTITLKPGHSNGGLGLAFRLCYGLMSLLTIGAIASLLRVLHFNVFSIALFLFFLSLVMFFGLKIRNSKKELVMVESGSHVFGFLADLLFLPMIRAGRWIALRAPRLNIFLFFLDFIIEAPFKATIRVIESWLAFLREKKEEI